MMINIFKEYLFANCNSFSIRCYGVPSFHLSGVKMAELIIFMTITYSFNIISIFKAIDIIVN